MPGVHPACHLDDGVLDRDGSYWPTTGGWHDAGDFRNWLSLTQGNLSSLADIARQGHTGFRSMAIDEMRWGNRLFHQMITEEGRVFEDVAGGSSPPDSGFTYEEHWWFENHPGCYGDASDNRWTDNQLHSGDERIVRTTYNPLVQFLFVQTQMQCAAVLSDADSMVCRGLAERAWHYGRKSGHDGRTLFIAQELLAALEMPDIAGSEHICSLTCELLARQETSLHDPSSRLACEEKKENSPGITGFFWEADRTDAYRSVAYATHPVLALLRLVELTPDGLDDICVRAREAVRLFCDGYLLADAASNPFAYTPYGVFKHLLHTERQTFRDAGEGLGIRSFMPPFNKQGIAHGTGSVLGAHALALAKAARLLGEPRWRHLAEKQIQWMLGHNTLNRSLFNGIGYRQPVGYGFRVSQIPEAPVVGFCGRPDDSPYLEESFAIEWNTLEYWDIPFAFTAQAICELSRNP